MPTPKDTAQNFPLGTLAMYGPTAMRATKYVAAVFHGPDEPASELQRWFVSKGDIRYSKAILEDIAEFFREARVNMTNMADAVMGCPHEAGIDYPLGTVCPECPFWAETDRLILPPRGSEPSPLAGQHITLEEVVTALSEYRGCPPKAALAAADFHRELLTPLLLQVLESAADNAEGLSDADAHFFCHSLYLLAKWREVQALPVLLRILSLSDDELELLAGEILFEDSSIILASVSGGDCPELRAFIENPAVDEHMRAEALTALGALVTWGEMPLDAFTTYLRELMDSKLEREPSFVWSLIAISVADFELVDLLPAVRKAYDEGLVDAEAFPWEDTEELARAKDGEALKHFADNHKPITDVAEATSLWPIYHEVAPEGPDGKKAKLGRNDQCPCGSGKKYKKCCGKDD